jgi:hypothetical protein
MLVSMLLFLAVCLGCVLCFFLIYVAQCFSTWITSLHFVVYFAILLRF